ncbi:MAG: EamA family transporter [Tannerellaceae bacterium]|jgi:drug/metabolite transporter (DMT)-like permease|nr:EamA family transporter [Tannerellaceae bacterium]
MMKPAGETNRAAILLAYFLIYVVWGSTYYFIGLALEGIPPFLLGALRFTAAGLILLVGCYVRGEAVFRQRLIRKSAISGLVLLFIDMAVIMLAQRYLSSSLVAIIAASTAIWIMALDVPMWKKTFRNPAVTAGILIGFGGVLMLYVEQLGTDHMQKHGTYGVLLLIFGCISWALGSLYAKYRSSGEEAVNAFAGSAWQMLFASAAFWLCAAISGDLSHTDFHSIPLTAWFSLSYLILFGSILAYSAYVWLLKVRPATEVGTHAYVNPFIAVFIGVIFGHEQVSWIQLAGLLVILLSVLLVNRNRKKEY